MNRHEYRFLLAERGTLNDLISRSHPDDVISRMSLQHRLDDVEEELAAYQDNPSPRVIDARLTFSGKPVLNGRGILASFGSDAVKAFEKAVASAGRSRKSHLSEQDPIPSREDYRLLVTGTVRGSFGFVLEDASQQPVGVDEVAPVELALQRVKNILEASSTGSDDELAGALAEVDRRAVKDVREFLEVVADNEAACAIEFHGGKFGFRDTGQVRRSAARLGASRGAAAVSAPLPC